MAEKNRADRNVLGDIARIAVGFGILATAAATAMAGRKHGFRPDMRPSTRSLDDILRQTRAPRRKPPEAGIAVPVVSPRGPLPKQGGAAAPLEFDA